MAEQRLKREAVEKIEEVVVKERIQTFIEQLVHADKSDGSTVNAAADVPRGRQSSNRCVDLDATQEHRKRLDQRRQRREEKAVMRGRRTSYNTVEAQIQDRSKSKAARIREEECKTRKRRGRRRGGDSESSQDFDSRRQQHHSGRTFLELLTKLRNPPRKENKRFTLRQSAGIFHNGTSSSNARRRKRRVNSSSQSCSSSMSPSCSTTNVCLSPPPREKQLVHRLTTMEASIAELKGLLAPQANSTASPSACFKNNTHIESTPPPADCELNVRHMPWATSTGASEPDRRQDPVPVLAFNNDQPLKHPNGWRGQHRVVHLDVKDIEDRFLQAGGARFRVPPSESDNPGACVEVLKEADDDGGGGGGVDYFEHDQLQIEGSDSHLLHGLQNVDVLQDDGTVVASIDRSEHTRDDDYAVHENIQEEDDERYGEQHSYTADQIYTGASSVLHHQAQTPSHYDPFSLTEDDLRGFWKPTRM